ncbi:phosphatase PAP2 family protein [Cellulomonas sp. URHE0023]|uniref:phosphatase PAP2 family protein n=1 Tax=Cellulomonas sp. URHE0023 TaxID=1380354 RepID=UPI000551B6FE|nr:phosphatase PAP2 family protein [Cellulomonas sp. URHE0023]
MTTSETDPVRVRPFVWAVLPGLVLIVLGLLVFFSVLDSVREQDDLSNLDEPVLEWLVAHRTSGWTAVLATITFLTGPVVMPVGVAVGCVVWARAAQEWWRPVLLAGATAGAALLGLTVKGLVARPRPPSETMFVLGAPHTASFPSGHTLGTATFLLVAGYLVCSRRPSPGLIVAWGLATVIGTVLVGLSRLYLGFHFVTDVVAAVALAVVVLGVVSIIDRRHTGRLR